jgi:hypothetical protein
MPWYAWVLVALLALEGLGKVARIGQPQEPITPGQAIAGLIGYGLMIWAVVALGTAVG